MELKSGFDDALEGVYGKHDEEDVDAVAGYQSLGTLSVSCFILGVLSSLTFIHWAIAIVPALGLLVGYLAFRKILSARDVTSGAAFTVAGVIMSISFFLTGYGWLLYDYRIRTPSGYIGVEWTELTAEPSAPLPSTATSLEGKRVFIRGYMYPGKYMSGIRAFTMCRTIDHCQYCKPIPNPTDAIYIKFTDNMTIDFTTRSVGIGGVFRVRPDDATDIPRDAAYVIEADCIR